MPCSGSVKSHCSPSASPYHHLSTHPTQGKSSVQAWDTERGDKSTFCPLVGVVCPNSSVSSKMASYCSYASSLPARSRMPGVSVAAPKYMRPARLASLWSWASAEAASMGRARVEMRIFAVVKRVSWSRLETLEVLERTGPGEGDARLGLYIIVRSTESRRDLPERSARISGETVNRGSTGVDVRRPRPTVPTTLPSQDPGAKPGGRLIRQLAGRSLFATPGSRDAP